jgi:hypothetical protein
MLSGPFLGTHHDPLTDMGAASISTWNQTVPWASVPECTLSASGQVRSSIKSAAKR